MPFPPTYTLVPPHLFLVMADLEAKGVEEVKFTGEKRFSMADVIHYIWRLVSYLRYGEGYGCDVKLLPNPLQLRAFNSI